MPDGDVTRVELGAGRRRLWPIVGGAVAAWLLLAAVLGSGGEAPDPAPGPSSTSPDTTGSSTTRRGPVATTTTTAVLAGAPLLGRPTGWHLVLGPVRTAGAARVLDLDTGVVSSLRVGSRLGFGALFGPPRPDGVFTQNSSAGVLWWRFPFASGTEVFLGPAADGGVFPVDGADRAWVVLGQSAAVNDARLVSLADGAPLAAVELPAGSAVLGAVGELLVVSVGGDTFRVGADGSTARISNGQPEVVVRDEVLVRSCDENLRCGTTAVDVATGSSRAVPGVGPDDAVSAVGPPHPDGRAVVVVGDPGRPPGAAVLLGPDGAVPLVPDDVAAHELWAAAWSPDGSLLFVPAGAGIVVVDPFAAAGPRRVATLPLPEAAGVRLAVVQPRTED